MNRIIFAIALMAMSSVAMAKDLKINACDVFTKTSFQVMGSRAFLISTDPAEGDFNIWGDVVAENYIPSSQLQTYQDFLNENRSNKVELDMGYFYLLRKGNELVGRVDILTTNTGDKLILLEGDGFAQYLGSINGCEE